MGIVGEDITNFLVCLHYQHQQLSGSQLEVRNLPDNVSKQKCGRHFLEFCDRTFLRF